MNKFSELRKDYIKHTLSESNVSSDPLEQFDLWFHEAITAGVSEPNAFTLATVDENGKPSARILLLKGVEHGGFVFYTNYNSDKARDLQGNPAAAMVFLWHELERQVRITGTVTKVSRTESEVYFHSRPRESQIGAWVSPQSQVIESRNVIEENLKFMQEKFKDHELIPIPEHWGGFLLTPLEIEFWQGRPNRLHDRLIFRNQKDNNWILERLAP